MGEEESCLQGLVIRAYTHPPFSTNTSGCTALLPSSLEVASHGVRCLCGIVDLPCVVERE